MPDPSPPPAARDARAEFLAGVREILPALVGTMPFGVVAGVATVAAGMTPFESIALSVFAFSGIAQLVVAQALAAQSPVIVALAAVLVVSLRHVMYSAAIAPHLAHLSTRWRVLLSYLMTDQSFALTVQRYTEAGERTYKHFYMLGISCTLFVSWQVAVVIGALAGAQVPASWSLDFVVTLTFIGLLVPALRTRADLAAGAVAAGIALYAAGLPYKLSLVVASLAGIVAGLVFEWAHGEEAMTTWILIVASGVVTLLLRASFIVFADPHKFPHLFRMALAFVPPAVLAAIVAPLLLMPRGDLDLSFGNPRWIAGLLAIVAAMLTRSALAAIGVGMAALWGLQALL